MSARTTSTKNDIYRRRLYKALRPVYNEFYQSYCNYNDSNTYRLAKKMIEEFRKLVKESKDSLNFVKDYIELNIMSDDNKITYNLLIDEYKSELTKLDSYVVKTTEYFNNRKNKLPFIDNNTVPNLFLKAVNMLLKQYIECNSICDGVKEEGVTYLVELSSSM